MFGRFLGYARNDNGIDTAKVIKFEKDKKRKTLPIMREFFIFSLVYRRVLETS